jgi:hypothetical protein
LGDSNDFAYNPLISKKKDKHKNINDIICEYNNPQIVFCYTHQINNLCDKLHFFKNPFILITHNSDDNIENNKLSNYLLNSSKIKKWYAQNICFEHPKLVPLPIGIANSMWPHGNMSYFSSLHIDNMNTFHLLKNNKIYFNFPLHTNINSRIMCYNSLCKKIEFLPTISPNDDKKRLATYQFSICPESNGVDTHRLWESIYLQTIPIVLNTSFNQILKKKYNLNMVLLNSWDDFDENKLIYNDYTFDNTYFDKISLSYIEHMIKEDNTITNYKNPENDIVVVLTCINNFQEYIITNIEQLLRLGHKNIYVLTNSYLINNFENHKSKINIINIDNYETTSEIVLKKYPNTKNSFRNGFWSLTSCRFFYIYEFMKLNNIENVIHLENDVLIYYNCDDTIKSKFNNNYLYIPFDTFSRNIASIMFIPNHHIFKKILDNYDYSKNDMENFSLIRKKTNLIQNLPILINNNSDTDEHKFVTYNFDNFNYIFDAAAIGQYLGGVDPLNMSGDTTGFINETCIIKYNKYNFVWKIIDGIKKPFIVIDNIEYPIFNLHIHSKNLKRFIDYNINDFDIVIPVGPNEKDIIYKQLEYTKKNIIGYRNIYLICYDSTINIDGCITIDERIFPFTLDTVINFHGKNWRNGWYLQQLLKLYAGNVIPDILQRYLVIDSDTFFLKPTIFIKNKKCLYNYGSEYHKPYYDHMLSLDKDLIKVNNQMSGICHHMIFETKYVNEIINKIEKIHNDKFYNVFLKLASKNEKAGASEYEIYFNYMLKNHSDKIIIRQLNWANVSNLNTNSNLDYISYHWYIRQL